MNKKRYEIDRGMPPIALILGIAIIGLVILVDFLLHMNESEYLETCTSDNVITPFIIPIATGTIIIGIIMVVLVLYVKFIDNKNNCRNKKSSKKRKK